MYEMGAETSNNLNMDYIRGPGEGFEYFTIYLRPPYKQNRIAAKPQSRKNQPRVQPYGCPPTF